MITPNDLRRKPPRPGTAVCALAKRYRETLDHWQNKHGADRHTQSLIDCCSVLINEGCRRDD